MNTTKNVALMNSLCCICGTLFAIEETLEQLRRNDGETFYCPNGHGQRFAESNAKKLAATTEERDEARKELLDYQVQMRQLKCELLKRGGKKSILNGFGMLGKE